MTKYEKERYIFNVQSPPPSPETYIPMKKTNNNSIQLVNDLQHEYDKNKSCYCCKTKICCCKCNIS